MWRDDDSNLDVAQDPAISGHFLQKWKLRTMAQGTAMKEIASSKLRRLLADNKSSDCTDEKVAGSGIFYTLAGRKSAPKWRGPTVIPGIDEAGVAAKFQGNASKVARYCVRERVDPTDVGDLELNPAFGGNDGMEVWLSLLPGWGSGWKPLPLLKRGGIWPFPRLAYRGPWAVVSVHTCPPPLHLFSCPPIRLSQPSCRRRVPLLSIIALIRTRLLALRGSAIP